MSYFSDHLGPNTLVNDPHSNGFVYYGDLSVSDQALAKQAVADMNMGPGAAFTPDPNVNTAANVAYANQYVPPTTLNTTDVTVQPQPANVTAPSFNSSVVTDVKSYKVNDYMGSPNYNAGGYVPTTTTTTDNISGGGYNPAQATGNAVPGASAVDQYNGAASPNFNAITTQPAKLSGGGYVPQAEKQAQQTQLAEDNSQFGYKVRLLAVRNFPQEFVVFEVTPSFSESRSVEYSSVSPIHMPGSIQVYKKTNSRTFSLTAHLISRTVKQATDNIIYLQRLRGWTMPYFGSRSATDGDTPSLDATALAISTITDTGSMLGAPPDVLYLYAYSSSSGSGADRLGAGEGRVNIKKLPVVITQLGITYPEDVDYLPVQISGEPFPVKMDVTIELTETHSPVQYENFSLSMFKQGKLVQF
jgi:hypothetical protein